MMKPYNSFHKTKFASCYCYPHGMYSKELHSLGPSTVAFTTGTHHATRTSVNQIHFFLNPILRNNFHSDKFFARIVALDNRQTIECFLNHYNFDRLKSRVNFYLCCIDPITSHSCGHTTEHRNSLP